MNLLRPERRALAAFQDHFRSLYHNNAPFPWQERLFNEHFLAGKLPHALDLPTGLGKTSVMAVWLLARALADEAAREHIPRRLVYVVDRRAVVDQATTEAERLRGWFDGADSNLKRNLRLDGQPLPISTLRGQRVDNREWLADPSSPTIIVGTVDMIGSRLLFSGYGVSARMRSYHAGLLGADALVVLDEAHLVPPFEALLKTIARDRTLGPSIDASDVNLVPCFHLMSLSATGRTENDANAERVFRLSEADLGHKVVKQRVEAEKQLTIWDPLEDAKKLADQLADRAWALATEPLPARALVYCNSREIALKVKELIGNKARKRKIDAPSELLVGERRVHEREQLFKWLKDHGFVDGTGKPPDSPTFVVATSAGEVGIDLDANHLVCDLVEWERMVQRLGRVNRRGLRQARIEVIPAPPKKGAVEWKEQVAQLRAPLDALRRNDHGTIDASPGAIAKLKEQSKRNPDLTKKLEEASTQPPLRPALTRALVDAWSMTSLEEHTGRADIQPWLRGWEEEEEPQTIVAWRRFLPWRQGAEKPIQGDVETFFGAAGIHLDETLEAPTYRVFDWLIARARSVLNAATAENEAESKLYGNSPALIILDRRGGMERALRLENVAGLGRLKGNEKERAKSSLAGRTLVISSLLGGLTNDGMLNDESRKPPSVLDDGWSDDILSERIGYCVIGPTDVEKDPERWKLAATISLTAPEDAESGDVKALRIYLARNKDTAREGDQAIAKRRQSLSDHHLMVTEAGDEIAEALGLPPPYRQMFDWVARHHDLGKDRDLWQNAMAAREPRDGRPWAKTTGGDGRRLNGYRHEFGSLRDVEANDAIGELKELGDYLCDLGLHLIAAHHGHARPIITPFDPGHAHEWEPRTAQEERARDAALRFARLQRRWGPWGLAWWEALFRAADQRASKRHDEGKD